VPPPLRCGMLPHLEALLASLSDRAIPSYQKYKALASHGRLKRELPHHTPVTAGGSHARIPP
jgi:hypothetical protein